MPSVKLDMPRIFKLFFLLSIAVSCKTVRTNFFDPFAYDAQAYEKVRLQYKIEGKGDTTLFFIHGWNLDYTCWQAQVSYFSPFYKLVLLDLAGHGQSGRNRRNWTIESHAKDVLSIISKERLKNVILVAHSMGGEIALDVAVANPRDVIGIIGVDNLKNVGMTISEEQRTGVQAYIKEFTANYQKMAEGMARENIRSKDSAIVHKIVNSYTAADPAIAVPTLMNLFPKAADAKNKLASLPFPMKFIMCLYSPYDGQALKKYCNKGFEVITIDSSGHFPMVEQPTKFNEALHRLLGKE